MLNAVSKWLHRASMELFAFLEHISHESRNKHMPSSILLSCVYRTHYSMDAYQSKSVKFIPAVALTKFRSRPAIYDTNVRSTDVYHCHSNNEQAWKSWAKIVQKMIGNCFTEVPSHSHHPSSLSRALGTSRTHLGSVVHYLIVNYINMRFEQSIDLIACDIMLLLLFPA